MVLCVNSLYIYGDAAFWTELPNYLSRLSHLFWLNLSGHHFAQVRALCLSRGRCLWAS